MRKVDCRFSDFLAASRRIAVFVMIAALFAVSGRLQAQAQSTVTASDSTATRVMACTACHGEQGRGSGDDYFPRLAGKPPGYLYNQLVAFRDGQRKYPPMNYLLAYLPDTYLREMADYFAAQQTPFPAMPKTNVGAQVLALGKKLVLTGDEARHIPACVACHGVSLTGVAPDIPGLLGLHSKYISAQLGASRYGTRIANKPNCMQTLTSRLSEADITAASAYLSSLPAPANPAPAPAGSLKLALTCEGTETK
ncbi:c-type cytochrome [Dyella sp. 2HG41-7]|uniref:c-type cytochrome n=1 Tax=Dyella sp. 2HG41-7 TaxID=2883239 RepID=UPI001F1BE737|nr:c-type cytochrome [Dyella sp. 2HG41-7]